MSPDAVNNAAFDTAANRPNRQSPAMLKAQVLLDRAYISVGAIDGMAGENTVRAIRAYEETHGLPPDGKLDAEVWGRLTADARPILTGYRITPQDVEGPFLPKVPDDLAKMAKLRRVSYTSPVELLAEKFHMDGDLLRLLNPGADFSKAGTPLTVAAVRQEKPAAKARWIEVDKSREAVIAYGADGGVVAYYPATIGSRSLPSPTGMRKVRSVANDPRYYYRPSLGFKGGPKENLEIAPGPNNPVGTVWIDLDEPGYGLHGTPEPERIGKASSHGCVRLANWDARELALLVEPGMAVNFIERGSSLELRRTAPPATATTAFQPR
jgi:lipoprotein-anchoring transpeptidase ErfK/SrfK